MRRTFELIKPSDELVVGYGRVSTGKQPMGISQQVEAIFGYAAASYLPQPLIFSDEGMTGATVDRPHWKAMWEKIAQYSGAHLIVWDVGRLIRDYGPGAELTLLCQHHNVVIHDCEEGVLNEDQLAEKVQFFSKERKKIATNLRRGRIGAVRVGRYPFAALPGYRKTADGVLEECPITGPVMRDILSRAASGENWGSLASYANFCGLRTRYENEFHARSLAQLCKNPVYRGEKTYNASVFGWERRQASNERRAKALRRK